MIDGSVDDSGAEAGATTASASPASRHAPRLSFEAVVRIACAGRRGIHTGFVRDISRGGMFLRLVDPEPVGRRLGFELFLPGWRMPARGVGEVAWERASYEGPGRPPGMALRFVALEARAIEMLAAVLPGGEAPVVEVLEPRRLPPVRRDDALERGARTANAGDDVAAVPILPAAGSPAVDASLEELLAASGIASMSPSEAMEPRLAAELGEDGPMIFVPPPPLPEPVLPPGPAVRAFVEPQTQTSPPRQRWGSAAAGIAALGAIASLIVVGAARRDVLPAENPEPARAVARRAAEYESVAPETPRASSDAAALRSAGVPGAEASSAAPVVAGETARPSPTTLATRLAGLRWEPLPAGGTRVVISLDGPFAASRLRASRIGGDSPRLVVRLLGLGAGAPRAPGEPATAEVRRIRAGRHDGADGGEIHLVLDLADPAVRLARTEVVGAELRLDLVKAPAAELR